MNLDRRTRLAFAYVVYASMAIAIAVHAPDLLVKMIALWIAMLFLILIAIEVTTEA